MEKAATAVIGAIIALFVSVLMFFTVIVGGGDDAADNPCVPTQDSSVPVDGSGTTSPDGTVKPMLASTFQYSDFFGTRGGSHQGVDMAAAKDTPMYAYAAGVVVRAGTASGFGHWIVIDHNIKGKMFSTVYGHMYADGVLVKEGQKVQAGQLIGKVGSDGGSTGPHLHFEVWPNGRFSGSPIDPKGLVDKAPDPRGSGRSSSAPSAAPEKAAAPAPSEPTKEAPPSTDPAPSDAELAPMPKRMGSEGHWQIDTVRVARAIAQKFPQVQTIGGWRPYDAYDDHPSGRAADVMIPNYSSAEGKKLGDAINAYVLANKKYFQIEYTIWRQHYNPAEGQGNVMEDRGSDTQNHFDHVHITTIGHGMPQPGTNFGRAPGGTGNLPSVQDCVIPGQQGGENNLAAGKVPPAFEPWIRKAGTLCAQIKGSLLAAQLEQESGFQTGAVSNVGAQGPAQFMPETWPSWGKDDDNNGQVSPNDIGDAVMAQGRFMCAIAKNIDGAVASGRVKDDYPGGKPALYLASYNAGEGAVLEAGGMPSGGDYSTQTRPYADKILARERAFRDAA